MGLRLLQEALNDQEVQRALVAIDVLLSEFEPPALRFDQSDRVIEGEQVLKRRPQARLEGVEVVPRLRRRIRRGRRGLARLRAAVIEQCVDVALLHPVLPSRAARCRSRIVSITIARVVALGTFTAAASAHVRQSTSLHFAITAGTSSTSN